jgi:hypothetical protein
MEAANLDRPLPSRSDLQEFTISGTLLQNEMRIGTRRRFQYHVPWGICSCK